MLCIESVFISNPKPMFFLLMFVELVKVYALTQRMEQLEKDRDHVRLALERTEAAMIGYRERAHRQEQIPAMGSNPNQVSLSLISRLACQCGCIQKKQTPPGRPEGFTRKLV